MLAYFQGTGKGRLQLLRAPCRDDRLNMTVNGNKLPLFAAFGCEMIAALTVAIGLGIGPALAWAFGGLAAWFLSMVL